MKKNIFKWLSIFVMAVVCVGFASCGDDDEDVNPGGGSGGSDSGVEGKFQGPKRVFGNNLLKSYGTSSSLTELTYNSDDFVTKIKRGKTEYEVSYSDNQVIVTRFYNGEKRNSGTFTIGSNGFAEKLTGYHKKEDLKFEYDSDGHLTKITAVRVKDDDQPWIGTLIWENGNIVKLYDNDSGRRTYYTYTSINNNVGLLYIEPGMGGDFGDFFDEDFYYIGLLGKGSKNLVKSYNREESRSGEFTWTLDDAGRPIKCVRTEGSSSSYTHVWNYR